jgi:hypothetical protein
MMLPYELEKDSEDLSNQEVALAIPVNNVNDMLKRLHETRCPTCGRAIEINEHALRRRAPFFYARMGLRCGTGHTKTIIFRADWLR